MVNGLIARRRRMAGPSMVGCVLASVLLLASSVPPALAASSEPSINPTMKLPTCPQPPNYLRAIEIEKHAEAAVEAARWPEADHLLDQALAVLGKNYDPYHRASDQTSEYLDVATYMEKGGHIDTAVRNKKFVLDNRLGMQIEPMLCNKIGSHIQH
jgi:hypothetical protein